MIWTAIECCVGVICASLPAMAPLLKRAQATTSRSSKIWKSLQSLHLRFPWQRSAFRSHREVHRLSDLEDVRREEDVVRSRVMHLLDKDKSGGGFEQYRSTGSGDNVHADEPSEEPLRLPHEVGDPWSIQPPPGRTLWTPPQDWRV